MFIVITQIVHKGSMDKEHHTLKALSRCWESKWLKQKTWLWYTMYEILCLWRAMTAIHMWQVAVEGGIIKSSWWKWLLQPTSNNNGGGGAERPTIHIRVLRTGSSTISLTVNVTDGLRWLLNFLNTCLSIIWRFWSIYWFFDKNVPKWLFSSS